MKTTGLTAAALLSILVHGCTQQSNPEVVTEIPWALVSQPLIMDTHSHTRFSDGSLTVDELVEKAENSGCGALAITDHSDLSEDAATPAYFEAIEKARKEHPDLILFAGLEWNIPPYNGREHVTILLSPEKEKGLREFKKRHEEAATAEQALLWLDRLAPSPRDGVLFYNHPSRKDESVEENLEDFLEWRRLSRVLAGFEGAPGHQNKQPVGSYHHKLKTRDRWDPVAAEIGGVWDQLLDRGIDAWAAIAGSDYHNAKMDHAPCSFSRIHLVPEDPSHGGVLAGLRAGSFWSDHGKLLNELHFVLNTEGLALPVSPGESVRITDDRPIELDLLVYPGPGAENDELMVELIGNGISGRPELLDQRPIDADRHRMRWEFARLQPGSDGQSAYFRLRIRKIVEDGPDLMAYTNPIRVIVR